MGIFNLHSDGTNVSGGKRGPRGPAGPEGPAGPGFNFTSDGQFDIEDKRLENVRNPVSNQDAVTKGFLENTLAANTTPIGPWTGTGSVYGNIDLGFDTSKALLFAIEVLCESKEAGYTFSSTFWLTKIIQ